MISTGLLVWAKQKAAKAGVIVASIFASLVSLLYLHNRGKRAAATEAVSKERERIATETKKVTEKTKAKRDEVKDEIAAVADSDLLERMRDGATDKSRK